MLVAHYTPHNLCHALGVGPFEPALADDETMVLRLLMTPSFHAELCLTLHRCAAGVRVNVASARSQIWRQTSDAPCAPLVDSGRGELAPEMFDDLIRLWQLAIEPCKSAWVILDGMQVRALARSPDGVATFEASMHENPNVDRFVAAALEAAWAVLDEPRARNAIADAGGYVGCKLPQFEVPPDKTVLRTMVLGSDDDTTALLDALKKHHPR